MPISESLILGSEDHGLYRLPPEDFVDRAHVMALAPAPGGRGMQCRPEDHATLGQVLIGLASHAPGGVDGLAWASARLDDFLASGLREDADRDVWVSALPTGDPVVFLMRSAESHGMTREELLGRLHAGIVLRATQEGREVPELVLSHYRRIHAHEREIA